MTDGGDNVSPAASEKPGFFYGYIVVAAAFIVMMIMTGALSTYGVFFKPLAEEFGWTRAVTAGAYSTAMLVLGLLFMVTGRLTDRFGPRLVVTICCVFLAAGLFLMSRVNSVWQLYFFFGGIVAIGLSGSLVPMMSTTARWFVRRRGMMTGIVVAGVGVGQIILPPLATHFISVYGWRESYIILGGVTLVVTGIAAQFLRRDPSQVGQLPDGARKEANPAGSISKFEGFSLSEAFRTRQFWMLCAMYVSYGTFIHPTMVHIVPHATDLGISAMSAAGILSVIGGMTTAGRIGIGSTADRIGNRRGIIIGFILAMAAFIWMQAAAELWMFYLFAVLFGVAYGALIALEAPMAAELFGLKAHGAILGVVHFGATLGAAISAPLTGRLFDITGSYQLPFTVFAAVATAGLVVALLLKPPSREAAVADEH